MTTTLEPGEVREYEGLGYVACSYARTMPYYAQLDGGTTGYPGALSPHFYTYAAARSWLMDRYGTITRQGAASVRPAFFVDGTSLRKGAREMLSRMARAGEVDFTLYPVVYGPASPREVEEMRAWLSDCEWADVDDADLWERTPTEVVVAVQRHYDGGVQGFVFDSRGATAVASGE